MATGMNPGVYAIKEKVIDDLEKQFHEKINNFTSDAKAKMLSFSREAAIQVEEKASSYQKKVENDLEQLNKAKESHTHQILGLRKLQRLLCDKTKPQVSVLSQKSQ
ncbi:hypothetical protein RRG08_005394 [Elysia crispata]|uniref:Uncharacterized protein n=1 Tax=Elysia crispata TaxID=231223 RepID=A0AAE0XY40_9GAST|nr:hypothetical protein RRG08_005394 [Elysia crispata]